MAATNRSHKLERLSIESRRVTHVKGIRVYRLNQHSTPVVTLSAEYVCPIEKTNHIFV